MHTNSHSTLFPYTTLFRSFYVDGVAEAAPQYNPSFYFTSSVQVGASQRDGTRPTASFVGLIDEVSVYNRALAASDVQAIYQASSSGKCQPASEPQCVQPPS